MNVELIREYCLKKKGASEGFPFDEETLVFKVMSKIFAILPLEDGDRINLKCDPDQALRLREEYEEVQPGYHMNKKYWNTVIFTGRIPREEVFEMIDNSYGLVAQGLKKSEKEALSDL